MSFDPNAPLSGGSPYPPSGGPPQQPGQPADPYYQPGPPAEPYYQPEPSLGQYSSEPPADQFGLPPAGQYQDAYQQPAYNAQGYPGAPDPYAPQKSKSGAIIVGILVGVLVLGGAGFGVWWTVIRDKGEVVADQTTAPPTNTRTPREDPTTTTAPPAGECWDGSRTGRCPEFEGIAAANHAFAPDTTRYTCEDYGSGYLPDGYREATICVFDGDEDVQMVITRWRTPSEAKSAFLDFGYDSDGNWGNEVSGVMGPSFRLEGRNPDTNQTVYYITFCYADIPMCLEAASYDEGRIDETLARFSALDNDEVALVAAFLEVNPSV